MSTKDITLESVINIMLECLHSFQNDGDKEGIIEKDFILFLFVSYFSIEWDGSLQKYPCWESAQLRRHHSWLLKGFDSIHRKVGFTFDMLHIFAEYIYLNTFRLEESDLATSMEVLLVLKDLLVETEIPAVNYMNDSMVLILR